MRAEKLGGREADKYVKIVKSPSDADYLDQLIPSLREASYGSKTSHLLNALSDFASGREREIEEQCNTNHQEFVNSVNQLLRIREGTVNLTNEILDLNQSIQSSTEKLVDQKKALVESRGVRQNIDEAGHALQDCLAVLRLANQVQELLEKKKYYAALRALDELQSVHLRNVGQYKISDLIQQSVPEIQSKIANEVMKDLNTWLFRIREICQYLGELSFYHTDLRKQRQKERAEKTPYLSQFKLNSAMELVADESEEYDLFKNEDVEIDFSPLFEALHIHRSLGMMDKFKADYATNRKGQRDLILAEPVSLAEEDLSTLHNMLENIAGFAMMERATMKKVPDLRSNVEVEELWDSLCQTCIGLMNKSLPAVDNAEHLLKIKNLISLFIQTMTTFNYSTTIMSNYLLVLFDRYAELLKQRFSEDFVEIVSTDDYMPMPIQNAEEYEKVVNVSWYTPDRPVDQMTFPTVFPFSQMYPLCCIDIRNFLNQFYFFSDTDAPSPNPLSTTIDALLRTSLDDLLTTKVCASLVSKLSSQYLGQIVQILINLTHFSTACSELESLLSTVSTSSPTPSPAPTTTALAATQQFTSHQKTAENRIFELVNHKLSSLIDTSEYDFLLPTPPPKDIPSSYITTLTSYLDQILQTALLSLPPTLKDLMLFNAVTHTATSILSLPLSPDATRLSPYFAQQLDIDISHFTSYVHTLPNNLILLESLDELTQTVALMRTEQPEEFYDISLRNKKYGSVDPLKGPQLLEKMATLTEVQGLQRESGGGGSFRGGTTGGLAAFQSRFMSGR
jgi:exocyst complex component 6